MFKEEAVKERKEFNRILYERIFNITNKPKSILDLGCGLSPIYFSFEDIYYLAVDTDKDALKKVKRYFRKNKIKGDVLYFDINNIEQFKILNKVDLVLIFKVLDKFKKQTIKEILKRIKTNYFVISFATRTISGKRMRKPRRRWFENLIKNFEHFKIRYYNEVFYIIKK